MYAGSLEVDNVVVNSSNIGHTSNPGLITLGTDSLTIGNNTTINGTVSASGLILGSTPVISSADELNKLSGIDTTSSELEHVHGVTSNIQTQLNDRYTKSQIDSAFISTTGSGTITTVGALNSGSISSSFGEIYPGSSTIKTDGNMTAGDLTVDNIVVNNSTIGHVNNTSLLLLSSNSLSINSDTSIAGKLTATNLKIGTTDIISTAAEINKLSGISTTSTELGYVNGVTSSIQTQLNTKLASSTASTTYAPINGSSTIVTTGALDSGSITSNFGSINVGGSLIKTTGDMQAGNLVVDNIVVDSSTIGHTSNTGLLLLEATKLTVNSNTEVQGQLKANSLNIGGTNITSSASELNILDGVTAVQVK